MRGIEMIDPGLNTGIKHLAGRVDVSRASELHCTENQLA